jgi:hypothetical protein
MIPAETFAMAEVAATDGDLGVVDCEMFLAYLAGFTTTALAEAYGMPITAANRTIKRLARGLLELTASPYDRRIPPHLSRLRNESTLWVFRLAVVAPEDVVARIRQRLDGLKGFEIIASDYLQLHALLMYQSRRWEKPRKTGSVLGAIVTSPNNTPRHVR